MSYFKAVIKEKADRAGYLLQKFQTAALCCPLQIQAKTGNLGQ